MIQNELEIENSQLTSQLKSITQQQLRKTSKIQALEQKFSVQKREKEKLMASYKECQLDNQRIKGYVVNLQIQNDQLNRQVRQVKSHIQLMYRLSQAVVNDLQHRLDSTIQQMALISAQLDDQKYDSNAQIRRLNEQISQLQIETQIKEREIIKLSNRVPFENLPINDAGIQNLRQSIYLVISQKGDQESYSKQRGAKIDIEKLLRLDRKRDQSLIAQSQSLSKRTVSSGAKNIFNNIMRTMKEIQSKLKQCKMPPQPPANQLEDKKFLSNSIQSIKQKFSKIKSCRLSN